MAETIVINNFGGRLTRLLNGDLNSGFAKFDTSFGYDPFSKPMNLTWLGQPSSIAGITGTVVSGINKPSGTAGNIQNVYVVTTTPGLYKIQVNSAVNGNPNLDSVIGFQSIHGTYDYGAALDFFGFGSKLYIAGDKTILTAGSVTGTNTLTLNGFSSVISDSNNLIDTYHPFKQFAGKLHFGNGPSIGSIDSSGTIVSSVFTINATRGNQYSQLNPPLPSEQSVRDLDVTIDGNYLQISASSVAPEDINPPGDLQYSAPGEGAVYGWNGVDDGVTTATTIPSGTATALQTYLGTNMIFLNDSFGSAVTDGVTKLLTLPNNKSPGANATGINGNFLTWMCPEIVDGNTKRVATLYYFGSLDQENPVGLYRLLRYETTLSNGYIYQTPYQAIVNNSYNTTAYLSVPDVLLPPSSVALGKHYFSTFSVNNAGVITPNVSGAYNFLRFIVSSDGVSSPQEGVYETQTQLFQKRIHIEQVRVYTESTIAGNGFQLDIIGVDGDPIDNGTFTYSFAAGDDITRLQGALQRINFNPAADAGFGFGIRITNTGTTNMTIKKIEVDYGPEGR